MDFSQVHDCKLQKHKFSLKRAGLDSQYIIVEGVPFKKTKGTCIDLTAHNLSDIILS